MCFVWFDLETPKTTNKQTGLSDVSTVAEVALAVGEGVGHRSLKSVEKVEQANRLAETGSALGGVFKSVLLLTQPAIILSNAPILAFVKACTTCSQ